MGNHGHQRYAWAVNVCGGMFNDKYREGGAQAVWGKI